MEGFDVSVEGNGAVAEKRILAENPDLVILDLMLPGKDGISICRDIRPHYKGFVIMFTAKEEEVDQVVGLEIGADDYLIKPVRPRILLAKVRAFLRREEHYSPEEDPSSGDDKVFGSLVISSQARFVTLDRTSITLTSMEFDLLNLLCTHPGEVLSRDFIAQRLLGREYDGFDRSTDTGISALRKKLQDNAREPKRIKTIRGKGYVFIPTAW